MKKFFPAQGIALTFLCGLLVSGCANKMAPPPLAADKPVPAETVATPASQPEVQAAAVDETPVAEQQPATKEEKPVVDLERIQFAFDQVTLSPEARKILAADASLLQASPELRVTIEGHCDDRGSDEYNLALGARRAQAAMNYLVSLGVARERLTTISYGEERPLDPANDEAAWAKNRRDEFTIAGR